MILSYKGCTKTDFFLKNLEETLKAIQNMNGSVITVKKIRTAKGIKSSDRSQTNFIWRSLDYLRKKGVLALNGSRNPKSYKIQNKTFDTKSILFQAQKERTK